MGGEWRKRRVIIAVIITKSLTFYGRVEELDALATAFESPAYDFHVIYGRPRVGKTGLLKEFCGDRPHSYFVAVQEAGSRQREKSIEKVADRSVLKELIRG